MTKLLTIIMIGSTLFIVPAFASETYGECKRLCDSQKREGIKAAAEISKNQDEMFEMIDAFIQQWKDCREMCDIKFK